MCLHSFSHDPFYPSDTFGSELFPPDHCSEHSIWEGLLPTQYVKINKLS